MITLTLSHYEKLHGLSSNFFFFVYILCKYIFNYEFMFQIKFSKGINNNSTSLFKNYHIFENCVS